MFIVLKVLDQEYINIRVNNNEKTLKGKIHRSADNSSEGDLCNFIVVSLIGGWNFIGDMAFMKDFVLWRLIFLSP